MKKAIVLVGMVLLGGAPVAAQATPPDGEVACRGLIALDRRLATLDREFGELNQQDPPEILAPKQKDLLKLMQGDAQALRKVLTQTGRPLGNEAADKYLPEFLAKNATFLGWFSRPDVELTDEQRQQVTDAVGEYRFEVGQSCDYYAAYNPPRTKTARTARRTRRATTARGRSGRGAASARSEVEQFLVEAAEAALWLGDVHL